MNSTRTSLSIFAGIAIMVCLSVATYVWATEVALTVYTSSSSGVDVTMASANVGSGQSFTNNGKTILIVQKESGADTSTLTIVTGATLGGFAVADRVVTLAPGDTQVIGPFDPQIFSNSSNLVTLAWEAGTTGTTVAAVSVKGY